jgi:hypothetical protein
MDNNDSEVYEWPAQQQMKITEIIWSVERSEKI